MKHGLVCDGEIVVTDEGDAALTAFASCGTIFARMVAATGRVIAESTFRSDQSGHVFHGIRRGKVCVAVVHCRSCD